MTWRGRATLASAVAVGAALMRKEPHPQLEPWRPPNPTLMQGIFFYQQTHEGELQEKKTKDAITKAFVDAGITPFQEGVWKKYVESSFLSKGSPAASHILHQVHQLQTKKAISAYLFRLGLDDQNPEDWNDDEVLRRDLVVPDADDPSSDEEEGPREGEGGVEMEEQGEGVLVVSSFESSSSEEEQDQGDEVEEEQEEQGEARASRARKRRCM